MRNEKLALSPERSLTLLCEWLGLPFAKAMLTPGDGTKVMSWQVIVCDLPLLRVERLATIRFGCRGLHGQGNLR